ncbi:MAG TPA: PQQ-binding-like beta-propeller repeat protein [Caulifigura sp.]|nr:PQQ-binding-like beta-propeller repeat protein [Caulifigura sp.]
MRVPGPLSSTVSRRRFLQATAAAGLVSTLPRAAFAEEPAADQWLTFRNGPTLPGVAASGLPPKLELLWQVPTDDGVVSTPVIRDGKAYVGTLVGYLLCLDLTTGKELWRYRSIESKDEKEFASGFAAPIGISGDLVFAGDDQGTFHAVDAKTGQKKWTLVTDSEIVGGPTFVDDRVMFGSHDGKLYCLKQADGAEAWKFETQGPVNATPTLSGGFTFITGCDKPIMRVIDTATGQQHSEIPLNELLIASAAVVDDILYFGTDAGSVIALDWKNKKRLWTYSVPNREQQIHSSPAISGNTLVIGSRDKHLHAIDRTTGKGLWTYSTRAKIDSSPVIVGDRVFFGSSDKFVYGVSLKDGKEVWKQSVGQAVSGSPAVASNRLVIGSETSSGRILCFGAK